GAAEVVPRGGERGPEGAGHEGRRLRHDRQGNVLQSEAEDEPGEAPRGGRRHAARSTGARGGKSSAPDLFGGARVALLVAEGLDRIEERGLPRRIKSKEDPDGGGERDGERDRLGRHEDRPLPEVADAP